MRRCKVRHHCAIHPQVEPDVECEVQRPRLTREGARQFQSVHPQQASRVAGDDHFAGGPVWLASD